MSEIIERGSWWEKPVLRTDEEEERERKVTWLELFYDLVFVVVIAQLAHSLAGHVSASGMLGFVLLFVPVWWVWIAGTFYKERFETIDISNRLFTFLQMLPVAAMAVFAHHALDETAVGFALSYAAARTLVTVLWLRGGWHDKRFRPVSNRFAIGFALVILLFVASVFVAPPVRFAMWGVALFIELVTPLFTLQIQAKLPRLSTSKLPERFGLFTIIVLGETIVGVVSGVAEQEHLTTTIAVTAALGIAIGFGLWWIYFDFVARRLPRPGIWWNLTLNYLHLPLVMGIVAVGAGVMNVVAHEGEALPDAVRWLLVGAVALALITMGVQELILHRHPDEPTNHRVSVPLKIGAGVIALTLGFTGLARRCC